MASLSIRYSSRHVAFRSLIRSSWHLRPIDGIGREKGNPSCSPVCSRRNRYPASTLPVFENGGVFTSPCSQTRGLSRLSMCLRYVNSDIVSSAADERAASPDRRIVCEGPTGHRPGSNVNHANPWGPNFRRHKRASFTAAGTPRLLRRNGHTGRRRR